jgi:hypothetical protein
MGDALKRQKGKVDWTRSLKKELGRKKKRRSSKPQARKPRKSLEPVRARLPESCPFTPGQLDAIIERAVRFIEERQRVHARQFRWEIGEHLFLNVYAGDEEYLRSRDRRKSDSLRDIAAHTGIEYKRLYTWVMAAVVRRKLAAMGHEPELRLMHFKVLDLVRDHMDAAAALALLAEKRGWSVRDLEAAARFWRDHLDRGGSLADLERDPEKPLRRKGRKKWRRKPPPGLLRVPRVLEVAEAWWKDATLSPRYRNLLARRLHRLHAMLVAGGRP